MIIFEKIRWKNFLSSGNTFLETNLNDNSTTLIVGHNGAGKSTILDALCFALFNKPFREIKKDQLINSIVDLPAPLWPTINVVELSFRFVSKKLLPEDKKFFHLIFSNIIIFLNLLLLCIMISLIFSI